MPNQAINIDDPLVARVGKKLQKAEKEARPIPRELFEEAREEVMNILRIGKPSNFPSFPNLHIRTLATIPSFWFLPGKKEKEALAKFEKKKKA